MQTVALLESNWVIVRPLCGQDEVSITANDTLNAMQLIDRVLVDMDGAYIQAGQASKLTASDRDRVLVALYTLTYGTRIVSSPQCNFCKERYDLIFNLEQLMNEIHPTYDNATLVGNGIYHNDAQSIQFRLPTGADEIALRHIPTIDAHDHLLQRCVLDEKLPDNPDAIIQAMEEVAPLVSADLDASCPECGSAQALRFEIQNYFLGKLQAEAKTVHFDVHLLARSYGWGIEEILKLPRSQRLSYVELLDNASNIRRPKKRKG